jgi:protein TonB
MSVAAALLCHVGLLYGFQVALRPLVAPEPPRVIEMALLPPPGDPKAGGAGPASVAASHAALPPRASEVPPGPSRPTPKRASPPRHPALPAEAPSHAASLSPAERAAPAPQAEPTGSSTEGPAPPAPSGGEGAAATGGAIGSATAATAGGIANGATAGGIANGPAAGSGVGPGDASGTPGIRAHPRYRTNPAPVYPALARSRHQEGLVLLRVSVTADGRAARVELDRSSGFSALDEAARDAVRDWEFEPARVGSRTVDSEIQVPVRFHLAE